jgi:hypothetical protein
VSRFDSMLARSPVPQLRKGQRIARGVWPLNGSSNAPVAEVRRVFNVADGIFGQVTYRVDFMDLEMGLKP